MIICILTIPLSLHAGASVHIRGPCLLLLVFKYDVNKNLPQIYGELRVFFKLSLEDCVAITQLRTYAYAYDAFHLRIHYDSISNH